MGEPVIRVEHLKKSFRVKGNFLEKNQYVRAVNDVSFSIEKGETLGIVGESGCGKSTAGRAILRLHEPTSGEVIYKGNNILKYSKGEMKKLRKDRVPGSVYFFKSKDERAAAHRISFKDSHRLQRCGSA